MATFTFLIALLLGAVALTRLAKAISVPYPSLLALGGAALALVPGTPQIAIEPELALALFVAPVLLDAAYDSSVRDLKDNWKPIAGLVFIAVGVTTVAVATIFHALVPDAPWAAAIALGAIVAPPDAAAAIAVLRQVKLPHRLLLILEGESLFNDATALLIFGVAIAQVQDGSAGLTSLIPQYTASVVGSVAVGIVLGLAYTRVFSSIEYAPASIVLQFAATFAVWILAQRAYLSPILTIVAYGIAIARNSPRQSNPFVRVQAYAVWETAVFLINILAFVLIGLQLGPLLQRLEGDQLETYALISGAVLATVIVVRFLWVMAFNTGLRMKNARFGANLPHGMMKPTAQGGLVIAWSGMRGIVTLAAALALPGGFPERDLIQFTAFAVVLGTLLIQGLTLGPLVRFLNLPNDSQVDNETVLARTRALTAALNAIDGDTSKEAEALRTEYCGLLSADSAQEWGKRDLTDHEALRMRAVNAAREAIHTLRESGEIGDDAFHRIEEALDRTELYAVRYATG